MQAISVMMTANQAGSTYWSTGQDAKKANPLDQVMHPQLGPLHQTLDKHSTNTVSIAL